MARPDRREGERRAVHDDCTAHSGMAVRLNVNLLINGIACIALGFLLSVAMETNSMLKSQSWRWERNDMDMSRFEDRIARLERQTARD